VPRRRLRKVSVYLPEELIGKLNRLAEDKGIGMAVLLRMWIIEKAKAEGVINRQDEHRGA